MKHKRSLFRFALAALMLVTGVVMLGSNLWAGIFVLFVAAYALTSAILWLKVERRPQEPPAATNRPKAKSR
ncbi:hypothetical protein QWJ34_08495 [Saccharibacillus sp. CPCC 101409]|uniref:hypothetical protein n=1 Tax=Saccharibacillus sp. CPCC 101409 TaxID=3058041 RepID=UPI0026711883|nr:hypothetical protein [Saccharibacillus sp. CPCC 101409]MDO3409800.1 hypothetical protein [Saccharibacillus sp. CPCC 101409]